MAEMTIRLQCDPLTGRKDIIVTLRSDEDLLPHEHEQRHRELVDKLIQGGLVQASEVGRVIVERVADEEEQAALQADKPQTERRSQTEGA